MKVARLTGLEPATPGVTGRYSNHLSYNRAVSVRIQVTEDSVNRKSYPNHFGRSKSSHQRKDRLARLGKIGAVGAIKRDIL